MDRVEAITRDFLKGHEQVVNAFNRLLALRAPLIPVAMQVRAEVVSGQEETS
jgi:hypothetical protein